MGTVRILFFAIARERAGVDFFDLPISSPMTLSEVQEHTMAGFPQLRELEPYLRWAVNQEFSSDRHRMIASGDEIALIPPVSGGDVTYLTEDVIDVDSLVDSVSGGENGAVLTFVGQVRNQTDDHSVTHLDYEAYEPMANRVFTTLIREAQAAFPGISVAIKHRLGRLAITEKAVVIAVGSPHRDTAFGACRFIIERLKTDVPIFKREYRENGDIWVGMGS